jgi:hypothetical protein
MYAMMDYLCKLTDSLLVESRGGGHDMARYRGIARSAEPGDEQRRRPARLPQRPRVHAAVVGDRERHGQPDQQAERGQQPDRERQGPAHREPHADQACEGGDERDDVQAVGQVVACPRAQREQAMCGPSCVTLGTRRSSQPGAIVVAGDEDAPAVAEVVDIVDKPAGRIVHLRILPGQLEDYQAIIQRAVIPA